MATATETSENSANRQPVEYPWTVTLPDGTTTLDITVVMATKVTKVIEEGIMMPADATPDELAKYNYFNWQESQRLKQYRATLEERRRQASISSARRRQLSMSSTGATEARRRSRFDRITEHERADVTRNLDNSFLTVDSNGIIQPKTAEGALISIGSYLQE